jgi:hypothetical protein
MVVVLVAEEVLAVLTPRPEVSLGSEEAIYVRVINASLGCTARFSGRQHHFLMASPKTISEQAINVDRWYRTLGLPASHAAP